MGIVCGGVGDSWVRVSWGGGIWEAGWAREELGRMAQLAWGFPFFLNLIFSYGFCLFVFFYFSF